MKYGPLSYRRLGSLFPRSRSRELVRDRKKTRMILAIVPPAPTGGGASLPFGPLSYYRLGQAFPRSESREFYRDHRKVRLIVGDVAGARIPIHWATTGTAQGLGDGSSEANRIELKKVMENDPSLRQVLIAGDTINCKDDGTLTYDGSVDSFAVLATAGTNDSRIMVRGYTTTPGDGGMFLIADSDNGNTNHCINFNSKSYWHFLNIRIKDCRLGYNMGSTFGHIFHKCSVFQSSIFAINVNAWVQSTATGDHCVWTQCAAYGVSLVLDDIQAAWDCNGRGNIWINCIAAACLKSGWSSSPVIHPGSFHNCIAIRCDGDGFRSAATAFVNCASIDNVGDGFAMVTSDPAVLVNCIAFGNGGAALDANTAGLSPIDVLAINCNLNPSGGTNALGKSTSDIALQEIDGTVGDPLWTNTSPPGLISTAIDLTPLSGSDLFEKALDFHPDFFSMNDFSAIGPVERQEPGSAGLQGIHEYYAGLLPVTKTEELI